MLGIPVGMGFSNCFCMGTNALENCSIHMFTIKK